MKTAVMLRAVFTQLMLTSFYCLASRDITSIGQGFSLPSNNILGEFKYGSQIFRNIPPDCAKLFPLPETKQVSSFFKSSESFYDYVSSTSHVSVSLRGTYTMGSTLDLLSKSIAAGTLKTSGYSLDIYALKDATIFPQNCQNTLPFSEEFMASFLALPQNIKDPNDVFEWLPYSSFLKKYGSHIVKEINHGSRLQQWVFAQSSKQYTERDLTIRACLDLSTNTGSLKVAACSNYTTEEKHSVEKIAMSSLLDIKGGTAETRASLHKSRTAELIAKFMIEAETSPGNVLYKWIAIWDLLKQRHIGTDLQDAYISRALNLEAYYKGILDFGCTKRTENKVTLRWFEKNPKSILPDFSCKLAALGCRHSDTDCHIGGAGSVCYCYGPSCVEDRKVDDPKSKIRDGRKIRRSESGHYYSGINNSCHYHAGVYCNCHHHWGSIETIWPTKLESECRRLMFAAHFNMQQFLFVNKMTTGTLFNTELQRLGALREVLG